VEGRLRRGIETMGGVDRDGTPAAAVGREGIVGEARRARNLSKKRFVFKRKKKKFKSVPCISVQVGSGCFLPC